MELDDLSDDLDFAALQQKPRSNINCDSDRLTDHGESEVVYSKENVAIHPRQYTSERITGRLRIIGQSSSLYLTWMPYEAASEVPDSAVQNLSVSDEDRILYAIKSVPLTDIQSIRRHIPTIGWQYIIVVLSSGLAFPPLYFCNGGVREFLAILKQYAFIVRSADDTNVFLLNDSKDPLQKKLSSLELPLSVANEASLHHSSGNVSVSNDSVKANDSTLDGSSRPEFRGRPKHRAHDPAFELPIQVLEKFSVVTKFARETTKQLLREIQDTRSPLRGKEQQNRHALLLAKVSQSNDKLNDSQSKSANFESTSTDSKYGKVSSVFRKQRKSPLTREEWRTFLDAEGRIMDSKALRKKIFFGGVENDLRKKVWKFLLGCYEYDSTYADRKYLQLVKKSEYEKLKSQWKSISERQAKRFSKFRERKGLIEKDVVRTDRSVSFYEGNDNQNITILRDILLTYSFYNFDLGYCQGMSDLLSPILFVIRDESEAFWSFVALMERLGPNFNRDQNGVHTQLFALMKLVELLDLPLHNYFRQTDCLNYFFCFRWILIQFKREFDYVDIMHLWEVLWTHYLSEHFHLYICVAILKSHRDKIMGEQMDFDTLLKFINELSENIDLNAVISDAEALCRSAGEHGAACIPPGTPPSLPLDADSQIYAQQDDEVL